VSVVIWILRLSRVPVSVRYPMLLHRLHRERAGRPGGSSANRSARRSSSGIGFIVVGVYLVGALVSAYLPVRASRSSTRT
jgi:hypothetical protein